MIPNCERHQWDRSEDECRECGLAYCESCLVYVNGANARPLCIQCALTKSGIRGSRRMKPTRRARRAHARAVRSERQAATVAARQAERVALQEAAATDVDLADAGQRAWVSLDASRWDVGAI